MNNKNIYILGISAFYHDAAACLLKNGEIIAAVQEERFTRKKHDPSFPEQAIQYCLGEAGIVSLDIDIIAFYDKPFLKFERLLETYLAFAPKGLRSFLAAMPPWIKQKIFLKDHIREQLGYDGEIIFPEHHHSHAASAFYLSPFREGAILTVDGVGEWTTISFGSGKGNEINIDYEMCFPHSLGLLYSAFTYYCGFRVNSGEYKLMGLAPYGEGKYVDLILDNLIDIKKDGSFKLNLKYFNYCTGLTMTNKKFHSLFGGSPRRSETEITQKQMDLAKSVQIVTEMVMTKIVNHIHSVYQMDNICLAGGVALNCVANGKILKESPFKNIWIQPAASDAGGALGAAFIAWHEYFKQPRQADSQRDFQKQSLLGPSFTDIEIEKFLTEENVSYKKYEYPKVNAVTAELLSDQKVVGWFQGRMEFGPRALGARSILGDPRSGKIQSIINRKIKFRESFRPFAPSVLAEYANEYFDLDSESPYMLLVAPVKEDKRCKIEKEKEYIGLEKLHLIRSCVPAITHVDYSARVQTVSHEDHPVFYDLIKAFYKKTNCPIVINTSFNVRGEPIVCTPKDAYRCFMRTNMDYLVMGKFVLDKKVQDSLRLRIEEIDEFGLD